MRIRRILNLYNNTLFFSTIFTTFWTAKNYSYFDNKKKNDIHYLLAKNLTISALDLFNFSKLNTLKFIALSALAKSILILEFYKISGSTMLYDVVGEEKYEKLMNYLNINVPKDKDLKVFSENNDNFIDYEIAENHMDKLIYFNKYQNQVKFILNDKIMEYLQRNTNYITFLSNSSLIFLIFYAIY